MVIHVTESAMTLIQNVFVLSEGTCAHLVCACVVISAATKVLALSCRSICELILGYASAECVAEYGGGLSSLYIEYIQ